MTFPFPDFELQPTGTVSKAFIDRNIQTYYGAILYMKNLPYGRNGNKSDELCVLKEAKGTCSTKHALLKMLADEQSAVDIKLMMGIFKMDETYAKSLEHVLAKYHLSYIPEAHNYLMYNNMRIDCTIKHARAEDFENSLLDEIEISPDQITDFKIDYHRAYLYKWMIDNDLNAFTLDKLWLIREECIQALS